MSVRRVTVFQPTPAGVFGKAGTSAKGPHYTASGQS